MSNKNSISVIIAALNEERNIEGTVSTVESSVKKFFDDYEILIFNDGSTDSTGQIAQKLSESIDCLRVFNNSHPKNLGWIFKEGAKQARMNYVILVNGKNDTTSQGLATIFSSRQKADLVIPYISNMEERSFSRRLVSRTFTTILNTIFSMNLKYYNDSVLHTKEGLSRINIKTNSYAFQAEALIKLVKSGSSYIEVGVADKYEKQIATKAFKLKNITGVARFLVTTIWDVFLPPKSDRLKS